MTEEDDRPLEKDHFTVLAKVFMPTKVYDEFISGLITFKSKKMKDQVSELLERLEKKYCNRWTGKEMEVYFDNALYPIGEREAKIRNSTFIGTIMLTEIRDYLGIKRKQ